MLSDEPCEISIRQTSGVALSTCASTRWYSPFSCVIQTTRALSVLISAMAGRPSGCASPFARSILRTAGNVAPPSSEKATWREDLSSMPTKDLAGRSHWGTRQNGSFVLVRGQKTLAEMISMPTGYRLDCRSYSDDSRRAGRALAVFVNRISAYFLFGIRKNWFDLSRRVESFDHRERLRFQCKPRLHILKLQGVGGVSCQACDFLLALWHADMSAPGLVI